MAPSLEIRTRWCVPRPHLACVQQNEVHDCTKLGITQCSGHSSGHLNAGLTSQHKGGRNLAFEFRSSLSNLSSVCSDDANSFGGISVLFFMKLSYGWTGHFPPLSALVRCLSVVL